MNKYSIFLFKGHHTETEIMDLKNKVINKMEHFEKVSTTLKQELEVFEQNRMQEFKNNIHAHIKQMLDQQELVLAIWEAYLPIANSIDLAA